MVRGRAVRMAVMRATRFWRCTAFCGIALTTGSILGAQNIPSARVVGAPSVAAPTILDTFENRAGWGTFPSDGVALNLLTTRGVAGNAMTLRFDFQGHAGYAIARKAFPIGTPAGNWSFSFKARGAMRPNTLEFKLLDRSGENVWWYTIPEFQPSSTFETIAIRARQIAFAWGPVGGGPPKEIASIEMVVTAGRGGAGTLTIDDLTFTPLPTDVPVTAISVVSATGSVRNSNARSALDANAATAWRATAPSSLTLDLGGVRTYGGIVIQWDRGPTPARVVVDSSNDGTNWSEAGRLTNPHGARSYLPLTDGSSRFLRLRFESTVTARSTGADSTTAPVAFGIRTLSVRPLAFAATPTALLHSIAQDAPRGSYPRSLLDEQTYWTVIGVSGGRSEALLSEDGQLELAKRGPSLEPFLAIGNRLVTWSHAAPTQSLLDAVRPIPTVTWKTNQATLAITAFAAGTDSNASTYARYRITNTGSARLRGTFWLALRPIQVNPPWQFLNTPGGAARVDSISWNGRTLSVNDSLRVQPLVAPTRVGVTALDGGEAVSWIASNEVPSLQHIADKRSLASAVMAWNIDIAAHDSTEIVVAVPLDGRGDLQPIMMGEVSQVRDATSARLNQVARTWAADQDAVTIQLPPGAPPIAAALKANLAWILINRDGSGIQPGSRSYERSWIRDGSLTAEALLRLGRSREAMQFADWFAQFQYPSGKVPCCVDSRGADPVDEHDSHGEFIHLVYEVWRYTGDTAFAGRMWPHVKLAVQFMDSLRATHSTPAYNGDSLRMYRGLLPASISHEGYSAKPMHSVWDDGFALLGYRDALALAKDLNHTLPDGETGSRASKFYLDFTTAIARSMAQHHIAYIPGSIELGDFDATSTTTLLSPGDGYGLPRAALDSTFARYYRSARARTNPDSAWENYTPYEWRTVGALLRLGKKTEALDMVNQFMGDRRPINWQQWAEVVWHDKRAPKFLGDMPHTWVGSDFIRSSLDLFAYEQSCANHSTDTVGVFTPRCGLIIGAGVPGTWFKNGDSVVVRGLRTTQGPLGYSIGVNAKRVTMRFDTGLSLAAGPLVVHSPLDTKLLRAEADGVRVPIERDGTVVLARSPRMLVLTHQ